MSIFGRKQEKSAFGSNDRIAESAGAGLETGLQKQASNLLTDQNCNLAFSDKISVGNPKSPDSGVLSIENLAHNVGDVKDLSDRNLSAQQAEQMLGSNATEQTFEYLAKMDRGAAVDAAVRDSQVQTIALQSDNLVLAEEVSLKTRGVAPSA